MIEACISLNNGLDGLFSFAKIMSIPPYEVSEHLQQERHRLGESYEDDYSISVCSVTGPHKWWRYG